MTKKSSIISNEQELERDNKGRMVRVWDERLGFQREVYLFLFFISFDFAYLYCNMLWYHLLLKYFNP